MIQAPCRNFIQATITSTTPVAAAPTALITTERCQPRSRTRSQWRTIPVWLMVKEANTPTTYNWMRRLTWAPKATMSTEASSETVMIPLENARRSPRLRYCRGIKRWAARMADRRGKSW
jgi:hypothetical protein